MNVYLVWGWDGETEYLEGVYASAKAAMRAHPQPARAAKGWREEDHGWTNQRNGSAARWITREAVAR